MKLRELRAHYVRRDVPADLPLTARSPITQPHQAAALLHAIIGHEAVEVTGLLLLDTRGHLIAYHELARGTVNECPASAREVIVACALANAVSVIVAHNHPSGDPTPSPADMAVLQRLQRALEPTGFTLADYIVIGDSPTRFYSYRTSVR